MAYLLPIQWAGLPDKNNKYRNSHLSYLPSVIFKPDKIEVTICRGWNDSQFNPGNV
jgi:hypothetical protein